MALNEKADIVLTHDGARPFVKIESIEEGIKGVVKYGACVIGVPVKDTVKVIDSENIVHHTPKRSLLWAAQTPQCFWTHLLKEGYEMAADEGIIGTDDSSLVEKIGQPIKMIMGTYDNIKITTPEDLVVADSMLKDKKSIYKRSGIL